METSGNERESYVKARIAAIDALTPSPNKRAERVFELLKSKSGDDVDTWDLLCFATLYLTNIIPVHPDLEKPVKAINLYLFNAHYFKGEQLGIYTIPEEIKNAHKKD